MLVCLRDGRKIIGILRSFDQFANIVLEQAQERVIVGKRFADVPLGLYVIRGENVVLLGTMVRTRTLPALRRALSSLLHSASCDWHRRNLCARARSRPPRLSTRSFVDARARQDDAKEAKTTSTLLQEVAVEEILEAKQEEAERNKLKSKLSRQMNQNDLFDL